MTRTRRVFNIIGALLAIQGSLLLMLVPDIAFRLIAIGVGMMLTYKGLRYIIYYLTHANHMVGGKRILLVGLILFDIGAFASALYDQAQVIMIIYVVGCHVIAAGLNMVRAFGNKKDGNPGWKIDLAQGIGNVTQVALCLIFINYVEIPVYIYCVGAIYTSILTMISSFKKTAIVYVQ
ncbi:MAG: DUF308 domain-containing protein [Lachnospiraceae bacterium]|nr:DUF308 domain-containing protein [Lachnospiraceae bacterium]